MPRSPLTPRAGRRRCAFPSRSCASRVGARRMGDQRRPVHPASKRDRTGCSSSRRRRTGWRRGWRISRASRGSNRPSNSRRCPTPSRERNSSLPILPAIRSTTGRGRSEDSASISSTASRRNFTLNAAINPDFGQVEVDPAVVNLTRVRDVLRREAAVLHRGVADLRQLRAQRVELVLGLQQRGSDDFLFAAHRPCTPGQRRRAVHRSADGNDDSRRREDDREDVERLDRRLAERRHRAGVRSDRRRRSRPRRGRAADQLLRGPGATRAEAHRVRSADDLGAARLARSVPARAAAVEFAGGWRRRTRLPRFEAGLGRDRQFFGEPHCGIDRGDHAGAGSLTPLLPTARRLSAGSDRDVAVRLGRASQPQSQQRRVDRERGVVGREPGIRLERCRLHVPGWHSRHARGAVVAETNTGSVQPSAEHLGLEVLHLGLERRSAGRRDDDVGKRAVAELLDDRRQRLLLDAGRWTGGRRVAVRS